MEKKPSAMAELRITLHKIWNDLPKKPVTNAFQNVCSCLQACKDNMAEGTLNNSFDTFNSVIVI